MTQPPGVVASRPDVVAVLVAQIEGAARGREVAQNLGAAARTITRQCRGGHVLSVESRDALLRSLADAGAAAHPRLRAPFNPNGFAIGISALMVLVQFWATPTDKRPPFACVADAHDFAQMFRNDLRNACIAASIDRRALAEQPAQWADLGRLATWFVGRQPPQAQPAAPPGDRESFALLSTAIH